MKTHLFSQHPALAARTIARFRVRDAALWQGAPFPKLHDMRRVPATQLGFIMNDHELARYRRRGLIMGM